VAETIDEIESAALVPNLTENYDELWMVVNRSNGRFIERLTLRENSITCEGDNKVLLPDQVYMDSAVSYDSPLDITDITLGASTTLAVSAHGLSDNDEVLIRCIEGTDELNDTVFKITNAVTDYFELNDTDDNAVDSSAYTAYISGGFAYLKANSFTDVSHLDGETVSILADGQVLTQKVSFGDTLSLDNKYGIVHVGLPYNSDFQTNNIEVN